MDIQVKELSFDEVSAHGCLLTYTHILPARTVEGSCQRHHITHGTCRTHRGYQNCLKRTLRSPATIP